MRNVRGYVLFILAILFCHPTNALSQDISIQLQRKFFGFETCIPCNIADGDFGMSVAGAGDIDGDGHADIIVGDPDVDDFGIDSRAAYVYSGFHGELLASFYGDGAEQDFGSAVSGAGDINHDGYADVIIGAPGWNQGRGIVRVYSGEWIVKTFQQKNPLSSMVLWEWQGNEQMKSLGWAVSDLGDLNRDGFDDFLVGVEEHLQVGPNRGSVFVISGKDGSLISEIPGPFQFDGFSASMDKTGDVNRDGYLDFAVGAPTAFFAFSPGVVQVISGEWIMKTFAEEIPNTPQVLAQVQGKDDLDAFGSSVSGAGDVDQDGFPDVMVGDPDFDGTFTETGLVQVISGKWITEQSLGQVQVEKVLFQWEGDWPGDHLGSSVSGIGDVDEDGIVDMAAGGWGYGQSQGIVKVFSGATGVVIEEIIHDTSSEFFGLSMDRIGIIEGKNHFAVGAPSDNLVGSVSLFALNPKPCSGKFVSFENGCGFLGSPFSAPTLVGDGYPCVNQESQLALTDALSLSPGILFIGAGSGNISLGVCDLSLQPLLPQAFSFETQSLGVSQIPGIGKNYWSIPSSIQWQGLSLYVQAVIIDPSGPDGFTVSNSLSIQFD